MMILAVVYWCNVLETNAAGTSNPRISRLTAHHLMTSPQNLTTVPMMLEQRENKATKEVVVTIAKQVSL